MRELTSFRRCGSWRLPQPLARSLPPANPPARLPRRRAGFSFSVTEALGAWGPTAPIVAVCLRERAGAGQSRARSRERGAVPVPLRGRGFGLVFGLFEGGRLAGVGNSVCVLFRFLEQTTTHIRSSKFQEPRTAWIGGGPDRAKARPGAGFGAAAPSAHSAVPLVLGESGRGMLYAHDA